MLHLKDAERASLSRALTKHSGLAQRQSARTTCDRSIVRSDHLEPFIPRKHQRRCTPLLLGIRSVQSRVGEPRRNQQCVGKSGNPPRLGRGDRRIEACRTDHLKFMAPSPSHRPSSNRGRGTDHAMSEHHIAFDFWKGRLVFAQFRWVRSPYAIPILDLLRLGRAVGPTLEQDFVRGNSSAGRAAVSKTVGREFEALFPRQSRSVNGAVADRKCSGLSIRLMGVQFPSASPVAASVCLGVTEPKW